MSSNIELGFHVYGEVWGRTARRGYDIVMTWTRVYADDGSSIKFVHETEVLRENGI